LSSVTALEQLISNPLFLGLLVGIIRSLAGYAEMYLNNRRNGLPTPYDPTKLLETLAIYEGVFIAVAVAPGIPPSVSAVLAIVVDVLRSIRKNVPTSAISTGGSKK